MSEKLYPERLRCKTCRKKLETTVLDGLFCSYKCAGVQTPSFIIEEAPRGCKREASGVWLWKTRFRSESEVPQHLQNDPATNIYSCSYCHFYHVGHSRVQPVDVEKLRRTVTDAKTLGSVIQRTRESRNLTRKQLAGVLKIPIIRVTEIEEGNPKASLVHTLAVLQKLRIIVELIER